MLNEIEIVPMEDGNSNYSRLVKMVCPSAEKLSVIVNNIKCDNCDSIFKNESHYKLHDLKVHQHKNLDKIVKECIRYHCPEKTCIYSPQSSRYFTTMKYLKQHYLKVHAIKKFSCDKCKKSYSTEAAKISHMRICGLQFSCICEKKFNTYEALLTHAKRLSHSIDEKYKNILKQKTPKISSITQITKLIIPRKPISILPNKSKSLINENSISPITCNAETQTDDIKKLKKSLTPSKTNKRRESRQTQTNSLSKDRKSRKTVETQTIPLKKTISTSKKSKNIGKKNIELNEDFSNVNLFSNSPLNLIQDFWEDRNTLGTQTTPNKNLLDVFNDSMTQTTFYNYEKIQNVFKNDEISTNLSKNQNFYSSRSDPMLTEETFNDRFSSIETQTEKPYPKSFFDGNILNSSNTETQTTEQFDNIEQLLYSNMCTQTCNDIFSSELGLSDIQTQTPWQELDNSKNNEKNDISINSCRSWLHIQMNHTETQTDLLSIFDELQ